MRFQDFVDALHTAGWKAHGDAQHTNIRRLWAEIFPTVTELEEELNEAVEACVLAQRRDAVVCAIISHWREFGPECGFDEVIDRAAKAVGA